MPTPLAATLVDQNGHPIGEYADKAVLGRDTLIPISIGGRQVAEVISDDARGTRMTLKDR